MCCVAGAKAHLVICVLSHRREFSRELLTDHAAVSFLASACVLSAR